jgi:hypothetical protein
MFHSLKPLLPESETLSTFALAQAAAAPVIEFACK